VCVSLSPRSANGSSLAASAALGARTWPRSFGKAELERCRRPAKRRRAVCATSSRSVQNCGGERRRTWRGLRFRSAISPVLAIARRGVIRLLAVARASCRGARDGPRQLRDGCGTRAYNPRPAAASIPLHSSSSAALERRTYVNYPVRQPSPSCRTRHIWVGPPSWSIP